MLRPVALFQAVPVGLVALSAHDRLEQSIKHFAVSYDALAEMVFVGFDSLQAATPDKCRPFDRNRNGMVLGEGAALLALENFELARQRGAPVLAEIIGYGISTDNFHITQPNPSGIGPRLAMERAVCAHRCCYSRSDGSAGKSRQH